MVGDGRFRDDLYYRINVLSIDVPPCVNGARIPVVLEYFIRTTKNNSVCARLTPEPDGCSRLRLPGTCASSIGNRTRDSFGAKAT